VVNKIIEYYQGDEDLLNKFHILAPTDILSAAKDTADAIEMCHSKGGVTHFADNWYATILGTHLFAWCIKFESRHTHKEEFLNYITARVKTAALYKRNTRADLFLRKNGFIFEEEVTPEVGESYLLYICQ
jgi:hypothetical protein